MGDVFVRNDEALTRKDVIAACRGKIKRHEFEDRLKAPAGEDDGLTTGTAARAFP